MMEKCISDLVIAIGNLDQNYLNIVGLNGGSEEYIQAAENPFVVELYHQFKSIIEVDKSNYYNNLQLHFDLVKERFNCKRPDIVLHNAPDNRDDQKLYIEVKTNSTINTSQYYSDFDKIVLALSTNNNGNHLDFKNAVFITVKSDNELVKRTIKRYFKENNIANEILKKAYSLHINSDKSIIIDKFWHILNNIF